MTRKVGWTLVVAGFAVLAFEAVRAVQLEHKGLWRLGRLWSDLGFGARHADSDRLRTLLDSIMYLPVGVVFLGAGAVVIVIGGWLAEIWTARRDHRGSTAEALGEGAAARPPV